MLNLSIIPPTSADAEALGKAYLVFHENINKVSTFRSVVTAGLETGAVSAQEQWAKEMHKILIAQNPTPLNQVSDEMLSRFNCDLLERIRSVAFASMDATCLILAHSVFEGLVHELIEILPSARRDVVIEKIGDRKLRIQDLKKSNLEELLADEMRDFVSELKRDTLKKKLAFIIFDCCGFDVGCQEPGYSFDMVKLIDIDKERQRIIHHSIFELPILEIESKVSFLLHTGDFLVCLLSRATGLEVNVRSAFLPFVEHSECVSKTFGAFKSLAESVHCAIDRWSDWVTAGQSTFAQNGKVKAMYEDYQEVMKGVQNKVEILRENRFADHIALKDCLTQADNAARTVIQSIESFLPAGQSEMFRNPES